MTSVRRPRRRACSRAVPFTGGGWALCRPRDGPRWCSPASRKALLALLRRRPDLPFRPRRALAARVSSRPTISRAWTPGSRRSTGARGSQPRAQAAGADEDEVLRLDLQVRGIALGLITELDAGRLDRHEPPGREGSSPGERAAPRVPDEDRGLGRPGLEGAPRAVSGHLRAAAPSCLPNARTRWSFRPRWAIESFGQGLGGRTVGTKPGGVPGPRRRVARLMGRRLLQTRVAFLAGSDVLRCPPTT